MAYGNIRSKLTRAICAYLVSKGNCGTVNDILPNFTTANSGYPNTAVTATISRPDSQFTGSRRIPVQISIKGSATQDDAETNPNQPRVDFDNRVQNTSDNLMQTDDEMTLNFTAAAITAAGRAMAVDASNGADPVQAQFAADNADMADFTCQNWFESGEGDGQADEEGCSWEEILLFEAIACPSALG